VDTFFFIGCRRSGTTALRRILNAHPKVYCSFESGIMYILKNMYDGGNVDSAWRSVSNWAHTDQTFRYARDVFVDYAMCDKGLSATRSAFFRAIDFCIAGMTKYEGDQSGEFLAIGEKDPAEYSDPDMNKFLLRVHPDAKFIHLVRHPHGFARSSNFHGTVYHRRDIKNRGRDPYELWENNEMLALEAEKRAPSIRIRYEDLCEDPAFWVKKIYDFLVPETSKDVILDGISLVGTNGNIKYGKLHIPDGYDDLHEIASIYGYE